MMRILLFGDNLGVPQLLRHIPVNHVVGIVGAVVRPQYNAELAMVAGSVGVPFLLQPKVGSEDYVNFKETIQRICPDLIWVNSYSMILRQDVLDIPRLGGINIHGALLPQYRGCNPTQWAILNGEVETGVTMHEMTDGLDEGAIIDQRVVPLFFEDTWKTAQQRIAKATDEMISANLLTIIQGRWQAKPQKATLAPYCRRRTPDDGVFHWGQPVFAIYNQIRALVPPLPPAFYVDADIQHHEISHYQTIWQVAALKYAAVGGGQMLTERVRLRPLLKADAPLLYEWITNRDLVILNSPFQPVSEPDHEAWVEKMMTRRSDLVIFVIEDRLSGRAIGTCQLLNINWRNRSAELQIRIGDEAFLGKGYGSEAVHLLTEFGFKDLNLHRIYLHVFASNSRAVRAYEKCGFEREGTLKEAVYIYGKWVDVFVMGLLQHHD